MIRIITFIILVFWSCAPRMAENAPVLNNVFDTGVFIENILLKDSLYSVVKTTNYNSVIETENIRDYNISGDFAILEKININNPNWLDKYRLEVNVEAEDSLFTYRAIEDDFKIESITARKNEVGEWTGFTAVVHRNSLISTGQRMVRFERDKGYQIIDKNTSIGGSPKEFSIEVSFKPD